MSLAQSFCLCITLLEAELKQHHFYHYPKDKGDLVLRASKEWSIVAKAFPSAKKDIVGAVDCYALGHDHASIYHCMMILERGLPVFAKRAGTKFKKDRPTWKDMIDDVRAQIDLRRNALHSPPKGGPRPSRTKARRERPFLEACGLAALEFKFFEHAWRNHMAHGRAAYDENDAKKVLEHVRTFMEVIATKLKLKEKA